MLWHDYLKSKVPELWHKLMDNFHVKQGADGTKASINRSKSENRSIFSVPGNIKRPDLKRHSAQALAHHISRELFKGKKLTSTLPTLLTSLNNEHKVSNKSASDHNTLDDWAKTHLGHVVHDTINSGGDFKGALDRHLAKFDSKSYTHKALKKLFDSPKLYGQLKPPVENPKQLTKIAQTPTMPIVNPKRPSAKIIPYDPKGT